jgi:hypothetical protein
MQMAAVLLNNEKAFDATGHSGLEYKLPDLEFSTRLVKLFLFFIYCCVDGQIPSIMIHNRMHTVKLIKLIAFSSLAENLKS